MSFDRGGRGAGFRRGGFERGPMPSNMMWPFPPGGMGQQQPFSQFNPPGTQWLQDMLGGGRMPGMGGPMPGSANQFPGMDGSSLTQMAPDEQKQYDEWLSMLGMSDNPMLRHVWTKMRTAGGTSSSPSGGTSKPASSDTPTPKSDDTTPIGT